MTDESCNDSRGWWWRNLYFHPHEKKEISIRYVFRLLCSLMLFKTSETADLTRITSYIINFTTSKYRSLFPLKKLHVKSIPNELIDSRLVNAIQGSTDSRLMSKQILHNKFYILKHRSWLAILPKRTGLKITRRVISYERHFLIRHKHVRQSSTHDTRPIKCF